MKRIYPLFAFLFFIVVLIACRKDNGVKPGPGKDLKLSAAELQEASADNTFSFDLFRSVAAQNHGGGNLFISPLSVSMALGMTGHPLHLYRSRNEKRPDAVYRHCE